MSAREQVAEAGTDGGDRLFLFANPRAAASGAGPTETDETEARVELPAQLRFQLGRLLALVAQCLDPLQRYVRAQESAPRLPGFRASSQ